jgi:hypothetical protein
MNSTKDISYNGNAITNETAYDSTYYSSHRIPVVLHRREIGKVFAEVKDNLVVIAGKHKKEHAYLIPKSKVIYFDEKYLFVSITDNSLVEFEI